MDPLQQSNLGVPALCSHSATAVLTLHPLSKQNEQGYVTRVTNGLGGVLRPSMIERRGRTLNTSCCPVRLLINGCA